jgi:hypothetical protein
VFREYQANHEETAARTDAAEYPYSFLLPVSEGRIEIVCRAERTQIVPVYSRIFGAGHVMGAWPYALVLSLVIYGIGRSLKKRHCTMRID